MTAAVRDRRVRTTFVALVVVLVGAVLSLFVVKPAIVAAAGGGGTASTGKADYAVSVSPTGQSVQAGKAVSFTVTIAAYNGYSGTVALSASSLPTGLPAATFSRSSVSMGSGGTSQTATMTVSTTNRTVQQRYTLTVNGTAGRTVRSAQATLDVSKTPGALSLTVQPASVTAPAGGVAVYDIALNRTGSANDLPLQLTLSGVPAGWARTFSPANPTTATTTRLQVTVPADAPASTYRVAITATATTDPTVTATSPADLVVTYSSRPFTLSFDVAQPLTPGGPAAPLDVRITNPNGRSIQVTNLTVSATGPAGTCPASNFTVLQYRGDYRKLVVPGGATRSLSVLDPTGAVPTVQLRDVAGLDQTGCRGTSVTLTYSGTAQGT